MNKDDLLKEAAKYHKEWIGVIKAHSFNKTESAYAEDFVQEAYIKLHTYANPKRVAPNGILNKGYFFFVLKSVLFDYRKANKPVKITLEDCKSCDRAQDQKGQHQSAEDLIQKIFDVSEEWNWYDKKLFEFYIKEIPSIRKLSEATKISTSSIYETLKNAKEEINKHLKNDYEEYKALS